MRNVVLGSLPLVLLSMLMLVQACGNNSNKQSQWQVDLTGQKSLDVRGLAPDGDTLLLSEIDGCVKLLFFSQMDCRYCRELIPKLNELMHQYNRDTTLRISTYAYTAGSDTTGWHQYTHQVQSDSFLHIALRIDQERSFIDYYGVKRTPTVFLIDEDDRIISPPLQSFDSISVRAARYLQAKEDC